MKGRLVIVSTWWAIQRASNKACARGARLIVTKASDRAAVNGTKPPIPDIVDKEKVKMDVQRAKEERETKRKEIEETIDSEPKNKNWELLSESSTN